MKEIFVNLKRFDVPVEKGGVCQTDNPKEWIENIIDRSVKSGLGNNDKIRLVYMLPESLIIPAIHKLNSYNEVDIKNIGIGCQGVFRNDIEKGKNFGAFTTNLPAAAAVNMGCKGAIIGHSEERMDKQQIILKAFNTCDMNTIYTAVDQIINEEIICALKQNMHVLFCIGETAEQRGEGDLQTVKDNIKTVLSKQLQNGLKNVQPYSPQNSIVIGYEPIWAIGPGKTPPDKEYISFVSSYIKEFVKENYNFDIKVVYGGGLKEQNAKMIGSIETLDGGLVALTRFTGKIGFYPEDLVKIIDEYIGIGGLK